MKLNFSVNGRSHQADVDPATPLLWVLRDTIGLTGTKFGCGIGQCGACTVHIDGEAARSCQVAAEDARGKIVTIEGLSAQGDHPVQKAWLAHDVPQCGYCQSGMIMAASALLAKTSKPTDQDINAEVTNICRCGTLPASGQRSIAQRKAREGGDDGHSTSTTRLSQGCRCHSRACLLQPARSGSQRRR